MTASTEKVIAATALAFIVWLMFTAGPMILQAMAEGPRP